MSAQRPIVIIGAPRSGTNMLRDVLASLPGVATWPCDEINLIWKHGNMHIDSDELRREHATTEVRSYVRRAFDRISRQRHADRVVEKTCANSLRVGFVDEILPDARYIYIVRDGRDAAVSAAKRWRAPVDLAYTFRKARYAPLSDVPLYASRFVRNRVHRIRSSENHLASWGPRFAGIDAALQHQSLIEVCALQWQRCVDLADSQFAAIDEGRICRIAYEDFIREPVDRLAIICQAVQVAADPHDLRAAVRHVTQANVGKWRNEVTPSERVALEASLGETLARHGYEPTS